MTDDIAHDASAEIAAKISETAWRVTLGDGRSRRVFCRPSENTADAAIALAAGFAWTPEQHAAVEQMERREAVDAERDRRIDGGFVFQGVAYQSRPEDRENMAGAATMALAAIADGAQPGSYRWHGGDADFAWISADNTQVAMDAQTVLALWKAAVRHKKEHIFAARALKDMAEIPEDFASDGYWQG